MPSQIEKERKGILEQINNQGRRLERLSVADAVELNARLSEVVGWLASRLTKCSPPSTPARAPSRTSPRRAELMSIRAIRVNGRKVRQARVAFKGLRKSTIR